MMVTKVSTTTTKKKHYSGKNKLIHLFIKPLKYKIITRINYRK